MLVWVCFGFVIPLKFYELKQNRIANRPLEQNSANKMMCQINNWNFHWLLSLPYWRHFQTLGFVTYLLAQNKRCLAHIEYFNMLNGRWSTARNLIAWKRGRHKNVNCSTQLTNAILLPNFPILAQHFLRRGGSRLRIFQGGRGGYRLSTPTPWNHVWFGPKACYQHTV